MRPLTKSEDYSTFSSLFTHRSKLSLLTPMSSNHPLPFHLRLIRAVLAWIPSHLKHFIYSTLILRKALPSYHNGAVFLLPFGLVLKPSRLRNEADALLFAHNTLHSVVQAPYLIELTRPPSPPSPRPFGYRGTWYMVSTWIDGDNVSESWDSLTRADHDHLLAELRAISVYMRTQTIAPSSTTIRSASGDPLYDLRLPWLIENPRLFTRHPDFADVVWPDLDIKSHEQPVAPLLRPFINREDVPIVFCHGDLVPRNVIFVGGLEKWRTGTSRIALIDWEFAAWAPDYWDAIKASWTDVFYDDSEWIPLCKRIFRGFVPVLEMNREWHLHTRVTVV